MSYLIHLSFLSGHLSAHCFQYLEHFCVHFFLNSFFMNNFCIALCFFSATKLWERCQHELRAFIWWINLSSISLIFSPSIGVKHFWVDLNEMVYCCANPQCRSSAYVGSVYVILILRAWQTSHKGQQSLTKLNAMQAAYMSESFPNLNIISGSGRNSSFVIQGTHHVEFLCFSKNKSSEL